MLRTVWLVHVLASMLVIPSHLMALSTPLRDSLMMVCMGYECLVLSMRSLNICMNASARKHGSSKHHDGRMSACSHAATHQHSHSQVPQQLSLKILPMDMCLRQACCFLLQVHDTSPDWLKPQCTCGARSGCRSPSKVSWRPQITLGA